MVGLQDDKGKIKVEIGKKRLSTKQPLFYGLGRIILVWDVSIDLAVPYGIDPDTDSHSSNSWGLIISVMLHLQTVVSFKVFCENRKIRPLRHGTKCAKIKGRNTQKPIYLTFNANAKS